MFTGLIEAIGRVGEVAATPGGRRLGVSTALAAGLSNGDSLAIDGVCLTATAISGDLVHADVSPETLRLTTLGRLEPGAIVNLERPLRADARFGGHFVQGHVDATGTLEEVREDGDSFWIGVSFPAAVAPFIVGKGSIAVNGISLTVAALGGSRFGVQVIPYTWMHTNLRTLKIGDPVNLECDILGKYVARAVALATAAAPER